MELFDGLGWYVGSTEDALAMLDASERGFARIALAAAERRGNTLLVNLICCIIVASRTSSPRHTAGPTFFYERRLGPRAGRPREAPDVAEPWWTFSSEPYEHEARVADALWDHVRRRIANLPTPILGKQPLAHVSIVAGHESDVDEVYRSMNANRATDRGEFERAVVAALGRAPKWASEVSIRIDWYGLIPGRRGPPIRWTSSALAMPASRQDCVRLAHAAAQEITNRLGRRARRTLALQLEALAARLLREEGLTIGSVAARLYDLTEPLGKAGEDSPEWKATVRALERAKKLIEGSA